MTGGLKPKDTLGRRIEELARNKARLKKPLHIAEELVGLQTKFFAQLENAKSENPQ